MDDWKAWIREIAYERIDQIERHLNANPLVFPEFAAAAGKIDAAMEETDAHPDVKLTERDDLWMTYGFQKNKQSQQTSLLIKRKSFPWSQ